MKFSRVVASLVHALVLISASRLFCPAQTAATKTPGGTVIGRVICNDSQRPARFAHVMIYAVPKQSKSVRGEINGRGWVQAQTDIDGNYVATEVAPGDYYVFATVAGYEQPRNLLEAAVEAGADILKSIPGFATVHVSSNTTTKTDVFLNRGAAISGRVIWEDGSPITDAVVTLFTKKSGDKRLQGGFGDIGPPTIGTSTTDDLGRFRIAGLVAGEYVVTATMKRTDQTTQDQMTTLRKGFLDTPLTVYAPAAFRPSDARPVKLGAAQQVSDIDISINLGALHSISGRLTSSEDGHGINSGMVVLHDTQDKGLSKISEISVGGSYMIPYVPSGTYDLSINQAADTVPSTTKRTSMSSSIFDKKVRTYTPGKLSVVVLDRDVPDQNLTLTPEKPANNTGESFVPTK